MIDCQGELPPRFTALMGLAAKHGVELDSIVDSRSETHVTLILADGRFDTITLTKADMLYSAVEEYLKGMVA